MYGVTVFFNSFNHIFVGAVFGPDGKLVLTAGAAGAARLWATGRDEPLQVFRGHSGRLRSAAFSPDGTQMLTAGRAASRARMLSRCSSV